MLTKLQQIYDLLSVIGFRGENADKWLNSYNLHFLATPLSVIEEQRHDEVIDYLTIFADGSHS